jgi:hypothetical protein
MSGKERRGGETRGGERMGEEARWKGGEVKRRVPTRHERKGGRRR